MNMENVSEINSEVNLRRIRDEYGKCIRNQFRGEFKTYQR